MIGGCLRVVSYKNNFKFCQLPPNCLSEISNDIRISKLQAIQVMQDYYLTHEKEIPNIVKKYDKNIGGAYLDEDIVSRKTYR